MEMEATAQEESTDVNVAELGNYLRRKRESESLSLRAVAKQTQVSASTLSRIENGTGIPDTPTLARLAKWLSVPFERIVGANNPIDNPITIALFYKVRPQNINENI